MAKPRPPVIISNGDMRNRFKTRIEKFNTSEPGYEDETDILYGKKDKNGFLTLVTVEDGGRFVFWRDVESDPKFTCLAVDVQQDKYNIKKKVVGEEDINYKV